MVKRFLVADAESDRDKVGACGWPIEVADEKLTLDASTGEAPAELGRNDE